MDRHARQIKLAEVGSAGQARIAGARVDVPYAGLAGEVAARYLVGAGVGRLRVRTERIAATARGIDPATLVEVAPELEGHGAQGEPGEPGTQREPRHPADESDLRDASAQAVERGARFALAALRHALGDAS